MVFLTSVRTVLGANEATDEGTAETRTQGMAVIASNNPNLKLNVWDKLQVNMEQPTRINTTVLYFWRPKMAFSCYLTDEEVPQSLWKKTDANGILTFDMNDIAGYSNVQVSDIWLFGYQLALRQIRMLVQQQARRKTLVVKFMNLAQLLILKLIYEGF